MMFDGEVYMNESRYTLYPYLSTALFKHVGMARNYVERYPLHVVISLVVLGVNTNIGNLGI